MSDPELLTELTLLPDSAAKQPSTTGLIAPFSDPLAATAEAVVPAPADVGTLLFQAPVPTVAPPVRRARVVLARPETPPEDPGVDSGSSADLSAELDSGEDESQGEDSAARKRRRRGGRGRRSRTETGELDSGADSAEEPAPAPSEDDSAEADSPASRRRRRRRRGTATEEAEPLESASDDVTGLRGSTRLEAKKQRRREGRETGRRRTIITEAEFLARRESVDRRMIVRDIAGRIQIAVLEDNILVEHYVANETNASMIGNVFLGRVQNVLPSMEAAFVDIGKGRNAVLYAGEVNWDAAGLDGQPRKIETALKPGDQVLVQVTKDPMGHKGARLTSQISLPGRYLVYIPNGSMTGISRKLPDTERSRLKKILKGILPEHAGVIVRTAAEGASAEELERDVQRLTELWEHIERGAAKPSGTGPKLVHGEPDLMVRVIRDVFNEDFAGLTVSGEAAWNNVQSYVAAVAPELTERLSKWTTSQDVFAAHRVDEQLAKAMDRKVFLPSGGSLVIDRTEAMTVVDVNTGKFIGAGGNLEETVTRNNLESAEEIVRQLRLRDIGGIIVIDFIDMVLESNRDLVLRRLLECLGRDRTKHQVAEVTSLGLVQMTRKRVGQGLLEVFSELCVHCDGRGVIVQSEPVSNQGLPASPTPTPAVRAAPKARVETPTSRPAMPAGLAAALAQPTDAPGEEVPEVATEVVEPRRRSSRSSATRRAATAPVPQEAEGQDPAPVRQVAAPDTRPQAPLTTAQEMAELLAGGALPSVIPPAQGSDRLADAEAKSQPPVRTTKPRRRRASAPAGPPISTAEGGAV